MIFSDLVAKLRTHPFITSSQEELLAIEENSGIRLPHQFVHLWLSVGGCDFVGKIISGPKKGKYLCGFWSAPEILKKLREDYDIADKSLSKIVPFGEDFFGNTLFLADQSGGIVKVLVADLDNQKADLVAERFDEFLDSLIVE